MLIHIGIETLHPVRLMYERVCDVQIEMIMRQKSIARKEEKKTHDISLFLGGIRTSSTDFSTFSMQIER